MSIHIRPPVIKTAPDREVSAAPSITNKAKVGPVILDTSTTVDTRKFQAQFKPDEFERVIGQHGLFVTWRKALDCPCHKLELQQADPSCVRCDGSGFYYVDPLAIQALIFSSDKELNIQERIGAWMSGYSMITVNAQHRLGYRDSLETRDVLAVFNEVLVKGNRRGRRAKLARGVDSARYRIVVPVYLQHLSASDEIVTLEEKKHFSINENGQIAWTPAGSKLIPDGAAYTIRYEFHPIYVIESWPHSGRTEIVSKKSKNGKQVRALPMQAVGRLDYLLNDPNTNQQLPTGW